jgi:predicted AlkP superfamily pyrophosphatase or phosphodiesterase
MKRRTVVLNVVGLTKRIITHGDTPHIRRFADEGAFRVVKPAFPAVTCTAQSAYLTGLTPSRHGIVGNGWYDRALAEIHFWKQSNHLVSGRKIWEKARLSTPEFTCAQLFWWFNRYSSVDYSITPRPIYCADGKKVLDITAAPFSIASAIKQDLGEFPFLSFWGPGAGIASSRWIAESAKWIEEKYRPSLNLVYLPHLDYNLQRFGPGAEYVSKDLRQIDGVVGDLIQFFSEREVQVVILSEYGITDVDRAICLNRVFRRKGWLAIKDELGREILDCGSSQAFAVADHQIAHVYVNNRTIMNQVRAVIEETTGVQQVLDCDAQTKCGIWHERSGDFVAVADSRSWFCYYYWEEDGRAPDFARTVDIHRKPGYDPAELFIDPAIRFPSLRIAKFLLKKRLGMRALLEAVPLDPTLVKGSHGRVPEDPADYPVLITERGAVPDREETMTATDVHSVLLDLIR